MWLAGYSLLFNESQPVSDASAERVGLSAEIPRHSFEIVLGFNVLRLRKSQKGPSPVVAKAAVVIPDGKATGSCANRKSPIVLETETVFNHGQV